MVDVEDIGARLEDTCQPSPILVQRHVQYDDLVTTLRSDAIEQGNVTFDAGH
jgi:hypothetical protein